jgi:hypothetical protein
MCQLAGKLLSRLKSGSMLLADRGYDADWIGELAVNKAARANIPPKSNRNKPICFSPYLYRARTSSNASSAGLSSAVGSRRRTTSSPRITLPLSSPRRYGYGFALMSPRPR